MSYKHEKKKDNNYSDTVTLTHQCRSGRICHLYLLVFFCRSWWYTYVVHMRLSFGRRKKQQFIFKINNFLYKFRHTIKLLKIIKCIFYKRWEKLNKFQRIWVQFESLYVVHTSIYCISDTNKDIAKVLKGFELQGHKGINEELSRKLETYFPQALVG